MKTIAELQQAKGTFSIGTAMSDGWDLVSRHLGFYIGAGILAVVIQMGVGIVPFAGRLANSLVISPCFMASAVFITWQISRGERWDDFGWLFKGFNYLMPVLISTLIQSAVMAAVALLCFFSFIPELLRLLEMAQGTGAFENQEEIAALARELFFNGNTIVLLLLFMLVVLLLNATWAFKTHFIVVYNMDGWQAMELSRRVTTPNIFSLLALIIVLAFIVVISAIPCGIGLLFSLPLSIGAMYSAFAQITESDQPDEINREMFDFMEGHKEDNPSGN